MPRQKRARRAPYEATGPNQCWCWDVTSLKALVRGMLYYLYMMIDVFSRRITAWEVHETESGEPASELLRRAVLAEGCSSTLNCLHADNGAIQGSSTLRATLEWLGVEPTYSRPRVSNDKTISETLFKTTKYRPDFPHEGFESIEQARQWYAEFIRWYNDEHKHSAIKFVTPSQRHCGDDVQILAKRDELYQQAQAANPSRWSGQTRNWDRSESMTLNSEKQPEKLENAA